mmetsp:Transcript_32562/g.71460  ORF Transcript_32562/g.71460 Transcript_32562/m.71460 type:complete len:217 (-) Transcript_32562:139-789(-)
MCSRRSVLTASVALLMPSLSSGFTIAPRSAAARVTSSRSPCLPTSSATSLSLSPVDISDVLSGASIHVSTVSADIDSIPTNEFGTVFAGGIAVMFGGVLSALIVGALLDSGDNYASVIADSYEGRVTKDDIMADEAFWAKLTPEQQEEAKLLLGKVKESKDRGGTGLPLVGDRDTEVAGEKKQEEEEDFAPVIASSADGEKKEQKKETVSMFDDYE